MGRASDPHRPRLCRRPVPGGDARRARHADRARQEQPVPRSLRGGKSRPVPPHEGRRISERRAGAARQDRHGVRQHQPARPGALPHFAREPSAHRHQMVDLPELRLRARPVRRDRRHHPFDLHARVRGPSAALRMAARPPAGAVAPAAVRIRPAQPDLHGAVQARAQRAGEGRPRVGLGRSAHADAGGTAPPRRAAGGVARLRQADRRRQGEQPGRSRAAGVLDPRSAQSGRRRGAWRCCGRSRW